MSVSLFEVLLAALPPLLVLVLMVGFQWGSSKAGPAGWFAALLIALWRFGATQEVLGYAHVRSFVLTVDVVYIVWAALLLYFVVREAGAMEVIADWFIALTGDDMLRVLLLGWVFTSFLQGVGGFGVPVAIVAPLLVGLGLSPLVAVVVPSLGHAWAVTFGSLGSSFIALLGVTGYAENAIAAPAAILLGASAFSCALLAAHAYGGWRGMRRGLPAILMIGSVMAVVQFLLATNGFWNIGAAGAGLSGLVVGYWVTRWPMYRNVSASAPAIEAAPAVDDGRPKPSFPVAIAGYAILVTLAFLIKGVPALKALFGQIKVVLPVPEVTTALGWMTPAADLKLNIFGHTGAVLVYSAIIAYVIYRTRGYYKPGATREIGMGVLKKGVSPALGIISMVGMATIMANVGMTRVIAEWLSQAVPPGLYAFVAAVIGALGAFMTGSNTNSNAVFGALQMDAAILLGINVAVVLAIQTASAAVASMLAPAKIIVGASTVGGDEGLILRKLLVYGGILVLVIMVLGFVMLLFV